MLRFSLALFFYSLMTISISAQITEANYRVYDRAGNAATLERIIDSLENVDVVFLGENHDDAAAHFVQAEIFKKSFERYGNNRKIALSMEMFERDAQIVVDEYLNDLISEKKFTDDSRPWNNYKTDYRPLFEFAKQNRLPVVAANAPRRYVNMVSRNGRDALDKLSPAAKTWIAPLPYGEPSKTYADKFRALMGAMPEASAGLNKILASQSLWDATMAYSIAEQLKKQPGALIIHLNGAFHSESRLGTVEHLSRYAPKTRIVVVTMKPETDFTNFDKTKHENLGDFVILTDAAVPRSFGKQ